MRDVVKKAQLLMRDSTPALRADGKWGPRTEKAFQGSPATTQQTIATVAQDNGHNLDTIRQNALDLLRAQGGTWITETQAIAIADRASAIVGIPSEYLRWMLNREPEIRVVNGVREVRVDSISPGKTYKGLFQVGSAAWTDAKKIAGVGSEIGSFDQNWRNPDLNALAAAAFARVNMGYARDIYKYRGPFSPELIYALHNQGIGFIGYVKAGTMGPYFSGQSGKAKQDLKVAASQVRPYLA